MYFPSSETVACCRAQGPDQNDCSHVTLLRSQTNHGKVILGRDFAVKHSPSTCSWVHLQTPSISRGQIRLTHNLDATPNR